MRLRIVSFKNKLLLYCNDGSTAIMDDGILRDLFVNHRMTKKFTGKDGRWDTEDERMSEAPGQTLVYVNDKNELCIVDSNPFCRLISDATRNEFITVAEYANRKKKSVARIKKLCNEERLAGAVKKGGQWFIPQNAPYPKDGRKKQ